jgi:integrase
MSVSFYKRTGKWRAEVTVDGATRHVGYFDSKREAKRAEAQARVEVRAPTSRVTVSGWREVWLASDRWKESTRRHNRERTAMFTEAHGERLLRDVNRTMARSWVEDRKGDHSSLSAMFGAALYADDEHGNRLLGDNPFSKLVRRRTPRRDLQDEWLCEEDIVGLEVAARRACGDFGITIAAMVRFMAETGLRPGEVFGLQWGDMGEDEVIVRRALNSTGMSTPKSGIARTVALSERARIAAYSAIRRDGQEWVFALSSGKPFSKSSWTYWWHKTRASAGRDGMHAYELRHLAATRLLEAGVGESDVAVQLGHADGGELVRRVYGHPSKRRAIERVRQALNEEHGTPAVQDPSIPHVA